MPCTRVLTVERKHLFSNVAGIIIPGGYTTEIYNPDLKIDINLINIKKYICNIHQEILRD